MGEYIWVLYVVAAVMFLVGLLVILFSNRKKKRCTQPVDATIVDVSRDVSDDGNGHKQVSYSPTYEYTYDGQTYKKTSSRSYSSKFRIKVGTVKQIKINPNKPTEIMDKGTAANVFSGLLLMVIAIVIVVILIIFGK